MENSYSFTNMLTDENLLTVGSTVKDNMGELIGEIIEITRDAARKNIEYVILQTDQFFGEDYRFFAIPAYSSLIEISPAGTISINANKDDLQLARGIAANKCPKPNFNVAQIIYELFKYSPPAGSSLAKK